MYKAKIFVGPIGSGKDYQCEKLLKSNYKKIAFADKLREIAWKIIEWEPENDAEYDKCKEEYRIIVKNEKNITIKSITIRKFLQNLGNTLRSVIDKDIWINLLLQNMLNITKTGFNVCCSDTRFPNEIMELIKIFKKHKIDYEFIMCNYNSSRKNITDNNISEKLAQKLIKKGYKDGHVFTDNEIIKICCDLKLNELKK